VGAKNRIELLDAWRGTAVVVMVFWHLAWDMSLWGVFPQERMFAQPAVGVRYFIVCSFVLLSGVSCRFSRSNARRGGLTLVCAAAITLVTNLVGDPAWFGILHLLGCCMLLYALVGRFWERLPVLPAVIVSLALFLFFHRLCYGIRVQSPWWWMFGFRTREFYSSDYYPLLPWGLLFFTGAALGGWVAASRGAWKEKKAWPPLVWVGQHALWIYMVHQVVLFGGFALVTGRLP